MYGSVISGGEKKIRFHLFRIGSQDWGRSKTLVQLQIRLFSDCNKLEPPFTVPNSHSGLVFIHTRPFWNKILIVTLKHISRSLLSILPCKWTVPMCLTKIYGWNRSEIHSAAVQIDRA